MVGTAGRRCVADARRGVKGFGAFRAGRNRQTGRHHAAIDGRRIIMRPWAGLGPHVAWAAVPRIARSCRRAGPHRHGRRIRPTAIAFETSPVGPPWPITVFPRFIGVNRRASAAEISFGNQDPAVASNERIFCRRCTRMTVPRVAITPRLPVPPARAGSSL